MDAEAPDLYTDSVLIHTGPFGVLFAFAMQPPGQTGTMPTVKVCNLRMSLEHAKVVAILLRKQLQTFETDMGSPIPLHPKLTQGLGISKQEDW